MGNHQRPPGQPDTSPATHRLIRAADHYLRERSFADCCNYALRARDSDPTHPAPTSILAVATVLAAPTPHNYYAVLGLPHFEPDAARIRYRYRTLASNLNPSVNSYPFADEALELVLTAWSVLSNPEEKARFDEELRKTLSASDGGGCSSRNSADTFWTICPYCYYVYEFERAYEDCCLRCSNEKCRRVLHAVAIGGPGPPPDVVEKGQYTCAGFIPLGISGGGDGGEKLWSPFEPLVGPACNVGDQNAASNGKGAVIDVSDEVMVGREGDETVCSEFQDLSHGKRMKFAVEASEYGEMKDFNGEGLARENEIALMERGVKEGRMMREKSVPWNSKKLMGRGVKIDENQANLIFGSGESGDSNVTESSEEGLDFVFGGEMTNGFEIESGVEFFEGDDDVLIGLQGDFDLASKELVLKCLPN
ncbi:Chaperone DnaJ-domain superfamily protein [Striga hermonthica]|uniref:Chaperone DnaJ-domain superfamily protein n=1 Tax=Striga hermonthica TaxID=68872 RepID=A0A9N7NJA7_STRHE|nr:Chaperone DnaJ-domain superfamily protein [Striga hermonthica]